MVLKKAYLSLQSIEKSGSLEVGVRKCRKTSARRGVDPRTSRIPTLRSNVCDTEAALVSSATAALLTLVSENNSLNVHSDDTGTDRMTADTG